MTEIVEWDVKPQLKQNTYSKWVSLRDNGTIGISTITNSRLNLGHSCAVVSLINPFHVLHRLILIFTVCLHPIKRTLQFVLIWVKYERSFRLMLYPAATEVSYGPRLTTKGSDTDNTYMYILS